MVKHFIGLEWKAFVRSASFGKSLGLRILLIFLALYFSVAFLALGVGLYPLLKEMAPEKDPLQMVNRFFLLWLVFELVLRFLLQTLPVMDIKPLMILPVKKSKVVNYVLGKSLLSFYNLLPILIFVPFAVFNVYKQAHTPVEMLAWAVSIISLSLCVNYGNFIIKKKFTENLKALIPLVAVIVILAVLDYLEIFQIGEWFGYGLDMIVQIPYLVLLPLLALFALYFWNKVHLEKRFYLDSGLKGKKQTAQTQDFGWTRRFGSIAPFLQQDLKLIWRNKRPRTTVFISFIFLAYGLLIYNNEGYSNMPVMFIFAGIFITGIFMINFGQFIPAWDASYYPMIMAQNIPMRQYLASKAGLMSFSVVVLTILSTPYLYYGWHILMVNLVCAVYNLGVNIPLLLYAGSFNKKRIDLDKSPFMNYQGTGAAQWLVALPLILVPSLLFYGMFKLISFEAALILLGTLGFIGLLLRSNLLNIIAAAYQKRKYEMIQGFKQTGE